MANLNQLLIGLTGILALSAIYLSSFEGQQQQQTESMQKLSQMFQEWKQKHGKMYQSSEEHDYKLSVFIENYEAVIYHNTKTNSSYKKGINAFSDLTNAEFKQIYLMKNQNKQVAHKSTVSPKLIQNSDEETVQRNSDAFFKGSVDFHQQGIMNKVQNQGSCGSCYTFATAAAMEGAYMLQTSEGKLKFSEQQIVSCSGPYGNDGCDGGFGNASYSYVIDNGLMLLKDYPYVSGGLSYAPNCQVRKGDYFIDSYTNVVGLGNCLNQQKAAQNQPLYGRVVADNWKDYESGVFDNCPDDASKIDHGITIVGFNTEQQDGDENYWIIRNSWGPDWGIDGYMHLKFGDTCAICHDAYFPTI